jgi:putative membrane protein
MRHQLPRQAAALLLTLSLFAACKSNRTKMSDETGMRSTVAPPADTGMMPANPNAAPADTARGAAGTAGTLSDANIMALLDEANKADSAAGAAAAKKATSPDVKTFAKEMMIDHHKLREAGAKLAKKLNITPEPPANDPLAPAAQDESSTLQSTPKGAEFDRVYIEKEVSVHQAVKDLLDQAHRATQNKDIQQLIETATPIIGQHLDHAQRLQKKLTKTA